MSDKYPQFKEKEYQKNSDKNEKSFEEKLQSFADFCWTWFTVPGITLLLFLFIGPIGLVIGLIWFFYRLGKGKQK
jgi:hypothetical protein